MNLQVLGPEDGTRASSDSVVVHGSVNPGVAVVVNGIPTPVDSRGRFKAVTDLFTGYNFVAVVASDFEGNRETAILTVVLPPQPFVLEVTAPEDQSVVTQRLLRVAGITGSGATARVNGRTVTVDQLGAFSTTVVLQPGPNVIDVVASSQDGQELTEVIAVIYRP